MLQGVFTFWRKALDFGKRVVGVLADNAGKVAASIGIGAGILGIQAFGVSLAHATTTPLATVTSSIDFTDLATDLTALLVAILSLVLILWGFTVGIKKLKGMAK